MAQPAIAEVASKPSIDQLFLKEQQS